MKQTKLESMLEATLNTASGFFVSLLVWQFAVAPAFGFEVSWHSNFIITGIFTGVSVLRSYLWRRFFNAAFHKRLARVIRGWL